MFRIEFDINKGNNKITELRQNEFNCTILGV